MAAHVFVFFVTFAGLAVLGGEALLSKTIGYVFITVFSSLLLSQLMLFVKVKCPTCNSSKNMKYEKINSIHCKKCAHCKETWALLKSSPNPHTVR